MKLPILASLLIFIGVLTMFINRSNRKMKSMDKDFWEKELKSNSVRKKPLDDLAYVTIDFDKLPMQADTDNTNVAECMETVTTLSERKIVNLSGISNTDLKLQYGTANITALSQYDENFTLLVTTLQKWAENLLKDGFSQEAYNLLEYSLSLNSDVGTSYKLLASHYQECHEEDKIVALYVQALNLTSPSGSVIAKTLKSTYPDIL